MSFRSPWQVLAVAAIQAGVGYIASAGNECSLGASRSLVFDEVTNWGVARPAVIQVGSGFFMYYGAEWQSGQAGIHLATSPDGNSWTPLGAVLTPSGYEGVHLYNCTVLQQGSIFKMWYTTYYEIGYATSTDGITWAKHPSPVLAQGSGAWDNFITRVGSVLFDAGSSTYRMWYTGGTGWFNPLKVGYATSSDGITWSRHPTPVLEYGETVEWINNQASVIANGGLLAMYLSSSARDIRLATSSDGINWSIDDCGPVLAPSNTGWDNYRVQSASPLRLANGRLNIWYAGQNGPTSRSSIGRVQVGAPANVFGDMNGDGLVDGLDIQPFVNALLDD